MRKREAIQPRKIEIVVVDVIPYTADNNGNNVNARRYCESATGVQEHGEYISVILSIPGRTYKFLKH